MQVIGFQTNRSGVGAAVAREAVESKVDLIVVCGGDGTINDVLGGMAHSQIPLAILAGGTANVLARELGLPLNISVAARLIPKCMPRRIALGNIGKRYFILMAGIGFDAQIVRSVNSRWKKLFGMGTYFMEALRQLVREPLHPFLLIDGQTQRKVTFACISRAKY
jgi:diacylglycerol kinase (ATP)